MRTGGIRFFSETLQKYKNQFAGSVYGFPPARRLLSAWRFVHLLRYACPAFCGSFCGRRFLRVEIGEDRFGGGVRHRGHGGELLHGGGLHRVKRDERVK